MGTQENNTWEEARNSTDAQGLIEIKGLWETMKAFVRPVAEPTTQAIGAILVTARTDGWSEATRGFIPGQEVNFL